MKWCVSKFFIILTCVAIIKKGISKTFLKYLQGQEQNWKLQFMEYTSIYNQKQTIAYCHWRNVLAILILAYIVVFLLVPLHLLVDVTQTLRQKRTISLQTGTLKQNLKFNIMHETTCIIIIMLHILAFSWSSWVQNAT